MSYALIGFISIISMIGLIVLYVIISAVRYVLEDNSHLTCVGIRESYRVICPKDGMLQDPEVCSYCKYFYGIKPTYILCKWEKGND